MPSKLHIALKNCESTKESIQALIQDEKQDVHELDELKKSPIEYAVAFADVSVVDYLLQDGNVNLSSCDPLILFKLVEIRNNAEISFLFAKRYAVLGASDSSMAAGFNVLAIDYLNLIKNPDDLRDGYFALAVACGSALPDKKSERSAHEKKSDQANNDQRQKMMPQLTDLVNVGPLQFSYVLSEAENKGVVLPQDKAEVFNCLQNLGYSFLMSFKDLIEQDHYYHLLFALVWDDQSYDVIDCLDEKVEDDAPVKETDKEEEVLKTVLVSRHSEKEKYEILDAHFARGLLYPNSLPKLALFKKYHDQVAENVLRGECYFGKKNRVMIWQRTGATPDPRGPGPWLPNGYRRRGI